MPSLTSCVSAAALALPALIFAVVPLATGTAGFVNPANVLILLQTATATGPATDALVAAAKGASEPGSVGSHLFALLMVARVESALLTGLGAAGLYALLTQPLPRRHSLHLANAVSFGIAACVHVDHLGLARAAPKFVVEGPVLEFSQIALVVDALVAALNLASFLASMGRDSGKAKGA